MSPGRSIPVRYLTLLGVAGAVACGDTHPTAPSASFTLSAKESAAFVSAVDDIRTRIEPALGNSPSVAVLHAALARMSAAVATRDRTGIESAISESQSALVALDGEQIDKAKASPDVDAVRLVLSQASVLLSQTRDQANGAR